MREGFVFLESPRRTSDLDMGIATMPCYSEAKIGQGEASKIPWSVFKAKINPLAEILFRETGLEYLITPKNVAWSAEDLNIYVGHKERLIEEIDDLENPEGNNFLFLNFLLAQQLSTESGRTAQISTGFNPQDFSVGHHTVSKLHSHVRLLNHPFDTERREKKRWRDFSWFDRLAFIEPFACLYHDFIQKEVREGLFQGKLVKDPEQNFGFTSLYLEKSNQLPFLFADFKKLYKDMKAEYTRAENVFTDYNTDELTQRYIPRPLKERLCLLQKFLDSRENTYSPKSKEMLFYLAARIQCPGLRKSPREVVSSGEAYITKGFAGAMSFSFEPNSNEVRVDFLPRVITTSAVAKTISGKNKATIIGKDKGIATESEKKAIMGYHRRVLRILGNLSKDSEELIVSFGKTNKAA